MRISDWSSDGCSSDLLHSPSDPGPSDLRDVERVEQFAGARQQYIACGIELSHGHDILARDLKIIVLGLEQVEQRPARDAKALGEHVARLAARAVKIGRASCRERVG